MFYSDDPLEKEVLDAMLLEWEKEICEEVRRKREKENQSGKTTFQCSVGKAWGVCQYRPEPYEIIPNGLVS